ncbi:MAG: DUF1836 domain-containing protein [Eubacteriales bacterium]
MKDKCGMGDLIKFEGISSAEIPNINLYMDQLLGLFDNYLEVFSRESSEKPLTKTMVNNYVKAGLIERPEKKKYNKSQIKKLIMIYHLKQVLSIQDINKFFELANKKMQIEDEELYDLFLKVERNTYKNIIELDKNITKEKLDSCKPVELFLNLSIEASMKKNLAEKLLDSME